MSERDDQQLWDAVVEAEQQVVQRRAEFRQGAGTRHPVLAAALGGSAWARRAALSFLGSLPEDVPDLLDELVDLTLSESWSLSARQAVAAGARVERDIVLARVGEIVPARLSTADGYEYRRLAELLVGIRAWETLAGLVDRARRSGDGEVREVGDDFEEWFGPMLSRSET